MRLLAPLLVLHCLACGDDSSDHDAGGGSRDADTGMPDSGPQPRGECPDPIGATQLAATAPDEQSFHGILSDGPGTQPAGLTFCEDGRVSRPRAVACIGQLSVNPYAHCDGFFPDYPEVCVTLDLDAGIDLDAGCRGIDCYMEVGCLQDDDCADDELCICASGARVDSDGYNALQPLSRCVPAGCRTNDDCDGQPCAASAGACGGDFERFDCRSADDTCIADDDCPGGRCAFDPAAGHFACGERATCE